MPATLAKRKRWSVRLATAATAVACAGALTAAPASAAPSQLKAGDSGTSVECLQKGLNLFFSRWTTRFSPLAVDGSFGSATTSKVNEFKTYFSLSANGIFGVAAGDKLRADNAYMRLYNDPYGYAGAWYDNCSGLIPHG